MNVPLMSLQPLGGNPVRIATITPVSGERIAVRVYEANHATESLIPKIAGSASKRFLRNSSITIRKFSGGILPPRVFQLLTAGRPRPSKSATAAVPPNASTTSSTDLSMPQHSLHGVNLSRSPRQTIDYSKNVNKNNGMDSDDVIGERLRLWVLAANLANKDVYGVLGCTKGAWSAYTTGKRHVTLDIADKLRMNFGLTLEWIYYGAIQAGMDPSLPIKMKQIRDNEHRGIFASRTRPPEARKPKKTNKKRA